MKILFAGNKQRGISCLHDVNKFHDIVGVITHSNQNHNSSFIYEARQMDLPIFKPDDVNDEKFLGEVRHLSPDITVLAGFGQIVKSSFIKLSKKGCINLHGGKLPQYRGSSPMNWALINGDSHFTISIIQVDIGVDTGDILMEKTLPINVNDTIVDLQKSANKQFPVLLIEALEKIEMGTVRPKVQDATIAAYYPLRFPQDGLVFFDQLNAEEIHNRVRALTTPYPGVISFVNGVKIKILKTSLTNRPFLGEAGRIYRVLKDKILVCASDKCLWIEEIVNFNTGEDMIQLIKRYEKIATLRDAAGKVYANK